MNKLYWPKEYVVIDLETTGLCANYDEIIELAAIKVVNGEVVESYEQLIKPNKSISSYITSINGIDNQMVQNSPPIEEKLEEYLEFIKDLPVIGHNVKFDIDFINHNTQKHLGQQFKNYYVDTMYLSRQLYPQYNHHRLIDLIKRFNLGNNQEHRALSDCQYTYKAYEYMYRYNREKYDKRV